MLACSILWCYFCTQRHGLVWHDEISMKPHKILCSIPFFYPCKIALRYIRRLIHISLYNTIPQKQTENKTKNIQVTATDGDKDREQNIVYFLTGQGIDPDNPSNSKFDINRTTGEIYVLKVSGLGLSIIRWRSPVTRLTVHY